MASVPDSRPDPAVHRLPIPEIVKYLVGLIGRKLTAYVGGVRDVRAADRWINGSELHCDAEQRLGLPPSLSGYSPKEKIPA